MTFQLKTETGLFHDLISFNSVSIEKFCCSINKHSEYTVFHVKSLLRHGNFSIDLASCQEGPLWTKDPMRVFRCYIAFTYSM